LAARRGRRVIDRNFGSSFCSTLVLIAALKEIGAAGMDGDCGSMRC
jgi:hypothetical protein